jgi:superfamily II DNA or RNA helicase
MGMNYDEFIKGKQKKFISSGFDIEESELNKNLFDFQRFIVKKSLKKGRYAIFADTGLGKTIMQLEWAYRVSLKTKKPVLILAPLAVSEQTMTEGNKFGIKITKWNNDIKKPKGIFITNYEQLHKIDCDIFSGIVLDESSILKSFDGKNKNLIIDVFKYTPYKLACSATPSPNDHMELGNHSEFLGAMSYNEMLAMYFVHDGGETSKWRLRKHAQTDFWNYVLSWAIAIDKPQTLGFNDHGYELPGVNFIEHFVEVEDDELNLFGEAAVSATELHRDLRKTIDTRVSKVADIINDSQEQWIVWALQNIEADKLSKAIDNSINVQGSDKPEIKAKNLLGFANNKFNTLVTKTKIASFGMNYQNCHNMIFSSYNFQFESFYQAVRRCYRFGQKEEVNVHIIIPKSQVNVRRTILEKERKHKKMIHNLSVKSSEYQEQEKVIELMDDVKTNDYHLMNGDCVKRTKDIESNSVDLCVFSPPFSELYVYSDKSEDMGNSANYDEFEEHFKYLIPELKRVIKHGRICAIHCMDLPIQKGKEGYIGIRDFSGMLVKWFIDQRKIVT